MDRLAGDVVPVGPRLVVDEEDEAVVQAPGAEVEEAPVVTRRQTDAAVADCSEADEVRLAGQKSLRDVRVRQLARQEGPTLAAPLDDNELHARRQGEARQPLRAVAVYREAGKEVRPAKVRASSIEVIHRLKNPIRGGM